MTTLDRYLNRQILTGILIATAILVPLFSFLDLIEQLEDVGQGFYTLKDAFYYTVLLIPRRLIQLVPFIALIGHVIALGRLAVHSEIISMRASGMSPLRFSRAPLRIALYILALLVVLEQYVAPELEQKALAHRSDALSQSSELGEDLGIWSRDASNILRIGDRLHSAFLLDVEIFMLDEQGLLVRYLHASEAEIVNDRLWKLRAVTHKTIKGLEIASTEIVDEMNWEPFLDPEQITTLTLPVNSLSPLDLYQYVKYLQDTGQKSDAYELTLWRKLGNGVITIAMVLLAVPFVFGSIRSGFANRLVLAGLTGICVYLFDQIFSNVGLIMQMNLVFIALAPGLILIWIARTWLQRVV